MQLADWVNSGEEGERRVEAEKQIHECFMKNEFNLFLCGYGLTSMPPLPAHVVNLNLSRNKLKSMSGLPPNLENFSIRNNELTDWPNELPKTLKNLMFLITNWPLCRRLLCLN